MATDFGNMSTSTLYPLALLLLTACASLRVERTSPDCNLTRREFDSPISDDHGVAQPRLLLHAEYAIAAYATTALVSKVLPPKAAAWTTFAAFAIVPHTRSILIQKRYPLTAHVAFVAVNRATPFLWLARQDTTKSRWKPAVEWLATDAALECWSTP
jgi:hypothetical protein